MKITELILAGGALALAFRAVAVEPDYQSKHLAIGWSRTAPALETFAVDSLGQGKLTPVTMLAVSNSATLQFETAATGKVFYKQGVATVWRGECGEKTITLRSDFSARNSAPFTLLFNQKAIHATLLGLMTPGERRIALPCVLHLPDMGTLRISCNVAGAKLDYDARRHSRPPFVRVEFPAATVEHPRVEYRLEVVSLYPALPGIEKNPLYDGFRRDFLNLFQVNPRFQGLANNASSDPVAFSIFTYSELAPHAPPLADGLTCLDLVRMTLDRYLAGAKGYGQVGYGPTNGMDVAGWSTPWTSLDTLPSFLIAACNYVDGAKDKKWAQANYDNLAAWAREMMAADKDGNGLIEYPATGNFGDRPLREKRPSNWWDTINFGHEDAYANALAYHACQLFAELARMLQHGDDAKLFSEKAAKLRAAYASTFLNPATGVLAGWKSADGQLHDYWFTFVQGAAITYGLLDDKTANGVMDHLLTKMQQVGYTNFSLGLPGNLVPVKKGDYVFHNSPPQKFGEPRLDDGSDGFQYYENGGATGCWAYYTIKALYQLGRVADARRIFHPMLAGYAAGDFQGFGTNKMSHDWRDWSGGGHGYEGLLVENYQALLAVLDDVKTPRGAVPKKAGGDNSGGMQLVVVGGAETKSATAKTLSPATAQNVTVFQQPGRYGGWPANGGMWAWGDELVVDFTGAWFKHATTSHAVDFNKPFEKWQARSLDGGLTWTAEKLELLSDPSADSKAKLLPAALDFTQPDFALTFHYVSQNVGPSFFYVSTNRCREWQGPFRFAVEGVDKIAARTDLIVLGKHDALMFASAAKPDNKEGRTFCARTTDGGQTWKLVSFIGPEPDGFTIMPATVRLKNGALLTAIRHAEKSKAVIDVYRSDNLGVRWKFLGAATGNIGGNPPTLTQLADGRLVLVYGYRLKPFGVRARISTDDGTTWGDEIILRDDGLTGDLGYPRTVVRADGKLVTAYYFNGPRDEDRTIQATVWTPAAVSKSAAQSKAVFPGLLQRDGAFGVPISDKSPKLFFTTNDIGKIAENIRQSTWMGQLAAAIVAHAEMFLSVRTDPYPIVSPYNRKGTAGRAFANRVGLLAFAGYLTGEQKFFDKDREVLLAVARQTEPGNQEDWETHLQRADAAQGFAIGYDWLKPQLAEAERKEVRTAIEKIARHLYEEKTVYASPDPQPSSCNHTAVHYGALGLCALVLGDHPEMLSKATERIRAYLKYSMDDTGYVTEGHGYMDYGMSGALPFAYALKRAGGPDLVAEQPAFPLTTEAILWEMLPDKSAMLALNDSDENPSSALMTYPMFRYQQPIHFWAWLHMVGESGRKSYGLDVEGPRFDGLSLSAPFALIWGDTNLVPRSPGESHWPLGHQFSSGRVFLRSAWDDPLAAHVSFTSGFDFHHAHNHQDENALTLHALGEGFLIDPGYKPKETRCHNTLLIGGAEQRKGSFKEMPGFGKVLDYREDKFFGGAFVRGQAGQAYDWTKVKVGNFDRKVYFVRHPSSYLIWRDDACLESHEKTVFTELFHTDPNNKIKILPDGFRIIGTNTRASCLVRILNPQKGVQIAETELEEKESFSSLGEAYKFKTYFREATAVVTADNPRFIVLAFPYRTAAELPQIQVIEQNEDLICVLKFPDGRTDRLRMGCENIFFERDGRVDGTSGSPRSIPARQEKNSL